jgi:hypothetical protein
MSLRILSVLSAVIVVLGSAGVADADTIAVMPTTGAATVANEPFALGWMFNVNEDISVTSLGAFDPLGNGHPTDQKVRIYDATNDTILVTATLGSSLTAETVGGYGVFFQSIAAVTLTTGKDYIAAISQANAGDFLVSNIATGSAISFIRSKATLFDPVLPASVTGFQITDPDGFGAYFGANFKYNAVPEPGTAVLLATGLFGLLAYAWRKRR